jgi:hypothetical protein
MHTKARQAGPGAPACRLSPFFASCAPFSAPGACAIEALPGAAYTAFIAAPDIETRLAMPTDKSLT